jgi:tRNA pseudouridine38-40 synthase
MRNIRLIIAYQGTNYGGWQIQPDVPTVQGVIEDRLQSMTQKHCRLRVAGRTDAGVHAQGQLANFFTDSKISVDGFFRGLNALLPRDISILAVDEVPMEFDSRRHNEGKHYRYTIWNQRAPSTNHASWSYHLYRPLDLQAMASAARLFVGTHDFVAFSAACCDRENTVRTLYRCTISSVPPLIHIDVEGTAFLRNMVRIIAGTIVDVGQGERAPGSISDLLQSGNRTQAGMTLPAHGLCLMRVFAQDLDKLSHNGESNQR